MIKEVVMLGCIIMVLLAGCSQTGTKQQEKSYHQIPQEQAKQMMDDNDQLIVLDVRTKQEYEEGHIPGAVLLPLDELDETAQNVLPDKEQVILVYCRSGNRSRQASELLSKKGYSDIYEFGGIMTWPYEIEQ